MMFSHGCTRNVAIQYEEERTNPLYSIDEASSNDDHSPEFPLIHTSKPLTGGSPKGVYGTNSYEDRSMISLENHNAVQPIRVSHTGKTMRNDADDKTSYQSEFRPIVLPRTVPVRRQDSLAVPEGSIDWSTWYRCDYTTHSATRLTPFKPRDNLVVGDDQIKGTFFRHEDSLQELDEVNDKSE
ncbi:hypothetical protein D915_005922 [Fasciola hepatica]|uniref:Uncharacterized protein n=1 Tax=Fasciola hepatica TaxID=6192 RepID=A0A4E0RB62_FASHE|nr:hypothetical protein D915_005922 [Fasciola hepatica]